MRVSSISMPGRGDRLRAGGDDDVAGADGRVAVAVAVAHADAAGIDDRGRAPEPGDPVLAQQAADASGQGVDRLRLARHHGREIERDLRDLDAVGAEP